MRSTPLSRLLLVGLIVFGGSGCVESPASWLPDSSGLLFVVADDANRPAVHHYDLGKKAHRLLAELDTKIVSNLAAHPDGRSFAVVTKEPKKPAALSIFDLSGKLVHQSAPLHFKGQRHDTVSLHWFPTGEQLWLGLDRDHVLYDTKKGTLMTKGGGAPWPSLFGSPLRPDGKGYVVFQPGDDYLFLDLEGWQRRLKLDVDLTGPKAAGLARLPRFDWDKHLLRLSAQGSTLLEADTEKGEVERRTPDAKLARALELAAVKGSTPVDVALFAGDETCLAVHETAGKSPRFHVSVHHFADNKGKPILTDCLSAMVLPAPDRKHMAILCEKTAGRSTLVIVNAKGEIHDEVPLGKHAIVRAQAADEEPPPPKKVAAPAVKVETRYYELALDTLVVRATKADGRNWDAFRGYPDLQVIVRNLSSGATYTSPTAADTLEHEYGTLAGKVSAGNALEIDVWDKDVSYDDHIGLKRLELTREMLERGSVELSFGQVSLLRVKFFPILSGASLKIEPRPEERAFEDGRIATLFTQLWPSTETLERATRGKDRQRAIVLIHGLRAQWWSGTRAYRPYFDSWQSPHSHLVKTLSDQGDIYGFSYGQNMELDQVSGEPALAEGVARLKKMGYAEVVLVGHSAGGVVARQFVEDHPAAGVTRVIQVCSPNAGACLAHCGFALKASQHAFIDSLTPQARMVCSARRDAKVPAHVSFVCLVGTYGRFGDCALSCHSQWPDDLQRQGIPAYPVMTNHHTCMESPVMVGKIAEVVEGPVGRWREDEVTTMRRVLFE